MYKGEDNVCLHCFSNVAKTNSHEDNENPISRKFYGKLTIQDAWSYFYFQKKGIAQKIIYHIKYKDMPELAVELGMRYGQTLSVKDLSKYDFIVPVPLHFKKLKKRGYNQSERFGHGLSKSLSIPMIDGLRRNINTDTQTFKSRVDRWKNVSSIFEVVNTSIEGKSILLVDDVITTGATLEACTQALVDCGCKVGIITLAVAK